MTLRLAMLKRQMLGMIVLNFCACLPLSLLATGAMVAVQDQATRLQQLLRQLLGGVLQDLYAQLPSSLLAAVAEIAARRMTSIPGPASMDHALEWRRRPQMYAPSFAHAQVHLSLHGQSMQLKVGRRIA